MAKSFDATTALMQLDLAAAAKKVTPAAAANIKIWLTEPRYREYAPQVAQHITSGKWKELDDAFWTIIPFGTGGRRGQMYPIGCNMINDRTIGESAQGLATYVLEQNLPPEALSCAIAYDTRHNSRHFAELCASIMVANGFNVFFLDDYRSTPELSFLVRNKKCACGIMVTASHNPPSDNAVKVYWAGGAQVVPPHDKAIVDRVMTTSEIKKADFATAVKDGKVILCTAEVDAAFNKAVFSQALPGSRDLKIIYSPLHGVGESAVCPALAADGFKEVEVFGPHREPSGDFPNVPGHVSNPENPAVFDAPIQRAQETAADVILATDPDCDRMGCAAPLSVRRGSHDPAETPDRRSPWGTFTGNQLGALLADYVCEQKKKTGALTKEHYLVTTLVTTKMIRRIGDSYGVKTFDNLHVGFKWIAQQMDAAGPEKFLFGTEESHGFLVGSHVRDKDAAVACMLMAELAAAVKATGKTLHEKLDSLYWQHGYHGEQLLNVTMSGSAGMTRMLALMQNFRSAPPIMLGGMSVTHVRDYKQLTNTHLANAKPKSVTKLDAPPTDMVILDLSESGNYIAVRPSGTEPKVKFYMFTYVPAEQLANLEQTKADMKQRMATLEGDLKAYAERA